MSSYLRRLYARLARHRYKLLLASLLLLVLGSGFAPATADPHVFAALLLQNLVVGVLVFAEEKPWLLLLCHPRRTSGPRKRKKQLLRGLWRQARPLLAPPQMEAGDSGEG